MEEKIEVIKENKDIAIAALNAYIDQIHNLTDDFFEGDALKGGLFNDDENLEKFVLSTKEDGEKLESVRAKLIANDFNLSLAEIARVGLSFYYCQIRMTNEIKLLTQTKSKMEELVSILMKGKSSEVDFSQK